MAVKFCAADLSVGVPGASANPVSAVDQSFLCRECARKGQTCCQGHEIYITRGDCLRIFHYLQRKDFYEYRFCCDPAYADQNDDPIWNQYVFRSDGRRRILKHKDNGDCALLTLSGCELPLADRPLVCRLYPHVYSALGIADGWDTGCPAATSGCEASMGVGIAGIALHDARQWHQLLYSELLWEKTGDEDWINL